MKTSGSQATCLGCFVRLFSAEIKTFAVQTKRNHTSKVISCPKLEFNYNFNTLEAGKTLTTQLVFFTQRARVDTSFSFFVLFCSYQSTQGLVTSIFTSVGNISLATLNVCYALACVFGPTVVEKIGAQKTLTISAFCYCRTFSLSRIT